MEQQLVFEIALLVGAYLFGSIPFSIILGTKIKGIDVREHGSRNPGGTNALRWLGRRVGLTVIFLDGLKGGLILLLIAFGLINVEYFHPLLFGVVAAYGHVFSIFIKFKGGKAVAATVGMIVGFNIIWALIAFVVFMATLKITKYVSLASTSVPITLLLLALTFGIFGWDVHSVVPNSFATLPYVFAIGFIIIFRHQKNYKNIRNGVEPQTKWW